jgi:hypothetical protein
MKYHSEKGEEDRNSRTPPYTIPVCLEVSAGWKYSTPNISPFVVWGSVSWMSERGWIRLESRVTVILRSLITLPRDPHPLSPPLHPLASRYLNRATSSYAVPAGVELMTRSNLTANADSQGDNK